MTTTATRLRTYPGTHAVAVASTADLSREDWLALRRRGIGGSDIGVVLGLNPWKSPIALWQEKRGEVAEQEANERMVWGTRAEDMIADGYAQDYGARVQRVNAVLAHRNEPLFLANVDRLIIDPIKGNGVLEVKNIGEYSGKAWDGDRVPDHYMMQLQWYLHVTGLTWGVFAALVGGQRLIVREVAYDGELMAIAAERALEFWRMVLAGEMPEPASGDGDALAAIYPRSNGEEIVLDPDISALIEQRMQCAESIKDLEEDLDGMDAKIKAALGENEVGLGESYRVTWRSQTRTTIDTKALRAAHPDIAEKFMRESTTRTFKISEYRSV